MKNKHELLESKGWNAEIIEAFFGNDPHLEDAALELFELEKTVEESTMTISSDSHLQIVVANP